MAYTDADEDAERLLSFGDLSSTGNEADEWVETHAGRSHAANDPLNVGVIDDNPDDEGVSNGMGGLSLGGSGSGAKGEDEIPDIDDIPDMEEEGLEEEDDEATAAPKTSAPVIEKCVISLLDPQPSV